MVVALPASSALGAGAPVRSNNGCESEVASIETPPVVAETPVSAFWMKASTWVPISFWASARASETAAPIANERATETALVVAETEEVSCASISTLAAEIPVAPSPSMPAWTCVAIRLIVWAPAEEAAPP